MILAWLDSLGLVIGYSLIAAYAVRFLRLRGMSVAFRRAWWVVLLMALVIGLTRLMVIIDPLVQDLGLTRFALHPIMSRVRAWLSLLAYLVLCVEFGRILLRER